MSEEKTEEKAKGPLEELRKKLLTKVFPGIWGKIATGSAALAILGYLFSWGFVTLNSLEEKVAKLEQKQREDSAQWHQILDLRQKTMENEIEIKVLMKLYEFQGGTRREISGDEQAEIRKKADKAFRELAIGIERLQSEKKRSPEDFRDEAMQQREMIQGPPSQAK
jgi:hypothetical protein